MIESYEDVPYPGYVYPQTQPDRLATVATLFGMRPAAVERCRVLELGCGDGANLIPMALGLPEARFTGIDLAENAICRGREVVEELGLRNIELHAGDVMQVGREFGEFDYVIAYGLYSWVAPEVREQILAIAECNLAPAGIAYVNYNTNPGGRLRTMMREMMLFHARRTSEPGERIRRAVEMLTTLAEAGSQGEFATLVQAEAKRLLERPGGVVYHDDLAAHWAPVWFHEFAAEAARHGLQYLAEAELSDMPADQFAALAARLANGSEDTILKEQYSDFLRCRRFRQTLLCRAGIPIERAIAPEKARQFRIASDALPVSEEEFRRPSGRSLKTAHPLVRAVMLHLSEVWPRAVEFCELLKTPEDTGPLGEILVRAYAGGMVDLHLHPPRLAARAGGRPVSSPLARLQACEEMFVTTLRHTRVKVEGPLERQLILLLDGTRDRAALARELTAFVQPLEPGRQIPVDEVEKALAAVARLGLLLA